MAKKVVRWDDMNKDNVTLEKLILQYEAFNRSEGKTAKTVQWYNTSLYLFVGYLKNNGIVPVLGNVDDEPTADQQGGDDAEDGSR